MPQQRSVYDDLLDDRPSPAPAAQPAAKNVYDDILDDPDKHQQLRMRAAQTDAQETTPDRRADVMRISQASGLPVNVVERDYDNLKKQFTLDQFPYLETQRQSPAVAEFLTDPNHAAIGQDDLANLSGIEWVLTVPSRAFAQQWNREQYAQLRYKSMFSPLTRDEQDAMNTFKFNAERDGNLGVKKGAFGVEFMGQAWAGAARLLAQAFTPAKYAIVGGIETAAVGAAYGSVVPGTGTLAGAVGGFPIGARAGAMYGVFKSANMQEAAATYDELLQEKDEFGNKIDPEVARLAAIGVGAVNGLIEQFGLEAFLSRFPGLKKLSGAYTKQAMKEVLKNPTIRSSLSKLAKRYTGGVSAEVATEVAQQIVTITGEELAKVADGGTLPARTKAEFWDELIETVQHSIPEFALGMSPGPVLEFAGDAHRAKVGEQTRTMFEALGGAVASSKTYERMPAAMQRFVASATKDGPVKEVYLPADSWDAYWQQKGQNPAAVAQQVTNNERAYEEGRRSGLIAIPTGDYAANLAGTEHNAFFSGELKLDPNMMNGREADEFKARVETLKTEALAAARAVQEAPDSVEAAQAREIERKVVEQLTAAGVPRETAKQQATAVHGFTVLAQRAGFDPADVLASYGVEIGRVDRREQQVAPGGLTQPPVDPVEDVPGMAALEADLADATIEQLDEAGRARNNASGESAASVEALNRQRDMNAAGKQFVVYDRAGRRRQLPLADYVDYKPQRGETYGIEGPNGFELLEDNGGRPPTDKRTVAILGDQLGKLLGQPRALPAVRAGIRFEGPPGQVNAKGEHAFFVGYQPPFKKGEPPMALYNIVGGENDGSTVDADMLRQFGIKTPETPPLLEFNQRALAATPALRDWFGSSVVRDEDGNPLTVFHGTTRTFTTFDNERANKESDFGAGFYFSNNALDTGANYAGIGPDLAGKIERRTEELQQELDESETGGVEGEARARATAELVEHEGLTMPVFLKIENPVVLGGDNETQLTFEQQLSEDGETVVDEVGTLLDFIAALREVAADYYDVEIDTAIGELVEKGIDGALSAREAIELLRESEGLQYATDDTGTLVSNEIIRAAFERAGFDGIVDRTVNIKFGSERRIGKPMQGVDEDTVHYIVFQPTQIKSAIGNRGTYDPMSPNVLFQAEQLEMFPRAEVFYSRLERGVEGMKQARGPGKQWKGAVKGLKIGISRDELAITRIEDLDDEQVYTKEEVLAYIQQNRPAANIVALGGAMRTVPSETETDLQETEEEDDEPDEDAIRERADEIMDRLTDEAYDNLDRDDYYGVATYVEDEIEREVEVEREVQATDENGEPAFDEDGDPIMETVTEYETEMETVYYPAIRGGFRVVSSRRPGDTYAHNRLESRGRREEEIIEDSDPYDNEDDAERAAERHIADLDEELIRERMYEDARDNASYEEAMDEAREELGGTRQREEPRRSNAVRYGSYKLEPAPIEGTYREVFITGSSIDKYGPTPEAAAQALFGKSVRAALRDTETRKERQKQIAEYIEKGSTPTPQGKFVWYDGHDLYSDIKNPIVRLRLDERYEVPPVAPDLIEKEADLQGRIAALESKIGAFNHKHHYIATLTIEEGREVNELAKERDALKVELRLLHDEIAQPGMQARLALEEKKEASDLAESAIRQLRASWHNQYGEAAEIEEEIARNGTPEQKEILFNGQQKIASYESALALFNEGKTGPARWLFIEEIQPPRPEQQKNMPPLFLANWREIAIKWALREAAERGVAGVAWTTGRQQVERYSSIEEHVQKITWETPDPDSGDVIREKKIKRAVTVFMKQGNIATFGLDERGVVKAISGSVHERDQFMDQPLDAIVPQELADKILDAETPEGSLEGKGLKIGGKGLAAVYDRDLPNVVNDLAVMKELGLRVGTTTIKAKAGYERELIERGDPRTDEGQVWAVTRGMSIVKTFTGPDAHGQAGEWMIQNSEGVDEVPAVRFTPELIEKITGGLALFQSNRYKPTSAAEIDTLNEHAQALAQKVGNVTVHMTTGGELFIDSFSGDAAAMKALGDWADSKNIQIAADKAVPADARSFFDFERNDAGKGSDPSSFGTWVRKAVADRKKQPRGKIQFFKGKTLITMFENADRSTFLHEVGHLYLEMMGDMVATLSSMPIESLSDKQQRFMADHQTILQWLEAEPGAPLTEQQLEKFAAGFETYLMEGKAPSPRLRDAFARFRVWFKQVYKSLLTLNAPLTDDVRKVFDRMLATDEEIAQMEIESKLVPMFLTAEQAKMTPAGFALYRQAVEEASRQAQEQLDRELQDEVLREQRQEWKDRKAEVKAQVTKETHALPTYRAIAAMRKGTNPDGTPITEGVPPQPLKLSKKLVVDLIGEARAKALPKGLVSAEGGVDPQVVADLFGFSSGDDLLTAVAAALPMQAAIKGETESRMLREHGAMLLTGAVQEHAREAISGDLREAVLREELKALAKLQRTVQPFTRAAAVEERREREYERRWFEAEAKLRIAMAEGHKQVEIDRLEDDVRKYKMQAKLGPSKIRGALPNLNELREQVRAIIANTKVADMRPLTYFNAARQASIKATEAAARQDFDTAITEKQKEITMLAFYRETTNAQRDVQRRVRQAQKLNKPASMARLMKAGESYHDQVAGVLDRFEFGHVPKKALDRRASLVLFLRGVEADGRPVPKDLPEILLNEARRVNYQQLTFAELVDVTEGLKQIVHLAQTKNRLLKQQQKRTLDAVAAEADASIRSSKKKREEPPGDRRASEERKRDIRSYFSSHRKLSNLMQQMDGWKSGGVMWSQVMRRLNDAANTEADMNADATKRLGELVNQGYPRGEKRKLYTRTYIPAIKKSLSKMERLMVALNWGNDGNRDRVLRGRGWNEQQVEAILDTLDERDWIFVQGVWDFLESYWPAIAAKQQRVTGTRPDKVQPTEVRTKFGTFRGGYFPLKYDDRISAKASSMQDLDAANLAKQAAYVHATTARGHVQARAETNDDPVRLDFGVIFEHVQQVVHDLSHHEALIDVGRILAHRKVVGAIKEHYGDQVYREIKNAVRDIAFGDLPAADGFERAFNHVRKGSTVVGLGWNLTTSALQILGLANTAAKMGTWWMVRGVAGIIGQPHRMNAVVEQIYAESVFMRTRGLTQQRELNEIRNTVGTYSGQFSGWVEDAMSTATADLVTKQGISDTYFYFIQKMQQMVDVPTYLGAKAKALAEGHDEATAIAIAEQTVLDTQGGGQIKDLASVQRGGPMKKLFTNFYSYFNVVYNQAVEIQGRTKFSSPASLGRMLVDYTMLFIVPASLSYLIKQAMKPGEDDDDEDLWLTLLRENATYMMGMLVGLREFSSAVQGYYGYEGPAGARFFSDGSKLIRQVSQGEIDEALLKSLNSVAGAVLHYPATQVWKTGNGIAALAEGETDNPLVLITGPEPK